MTIQNFRQFADRSDYAFVDEAMNFVGRLDARGWGKRGNLLLYFTEVGGTGRFCLSAWWTEDYRGREGGINFKDDAELGRLYRCRVQLTATGRADLFHAEAVAGGS